MDQIKYKIVSLGYSRDLEMNHRRNNDNQLQIWLEIWLMTTETEFKEFLYSKTKYKQIQLIIRTLIFQLMLKMEQSR
jgi:hypothetical protein